MRVLVIGGSGLVGRPTASELVRRGHTVAVLTRSGAGGPPGTQAFAGDVTTGAGVAAALDSADCVVDCGNVVTVRRKTAVDFFTTTTRRLGELGKAAGVRHHVVLGIVNSDKVAFPYFAGKLAQERTALDGPVPATVLRATQFHEFAGQVLGQLRVARWSFVPEALIQPIAAAEVGVALAEVVEAGPNGRVRDIAGPRPERLTDMARQVVAHRGERRTVVGLRLPGRTPHAMRDGAQLPGGDALLRGPTFREWLLA
jgi:uncharacterized protein YbjT (DUF2867 family)